jgi:putative NADH-flavin reductase
VDIAVYGATGAIGSKIVEEAVSRGHDVTGVSRRGGAIENAGIISADLTDTAEFVRVANENDVVVIAAGPPRTGDSHEPTIQAHRDIIASGVKARVFVVGGAGSLFAGDVRLKDTEGFPEIYKPEAETMTSVLNLYTASSGLDWTVLSPAPEIAPGARTAKYVVGLESPVGSSISTEDFAVAVLDELETPAHRQERFTVAN